MSPAELSKHEAELIVSAENEENQGIGLIRRDYVLLFVVTIAIPAILIVVGSMI